MSKYKFNTPWESDYWMASNGFYCGFNMPKAKTGNDINSLPEYSWRKPFLTDDYPAIPSNWMLSQGRMASYFVGVQKDYGMWLDFNKNSSHKYDVAIVVSVQGINPITGLPCVDPCLEQYIDTCPKCKEKFEANRYCKKCEMHWPKQNYICTNGQPNGQMWIDGFKTAEGIVRQYLFTEETMKGVASNVIGKERVFAIGISFFLSKNQKPAQPEPVYRTMHLSTSSASTKCSTSGAIYGQPQFYSPVHTPADWQIKGTRGSKRSKGGGSSCGPIGATIGHMSDTNTYTQNLGGGGTTSSLSAPDLVCGDFQKNAWDNSDSDSFAAPAAGACYSAPEVSVKQMEVGAGAQINQRIYDDPETLDYWREVPESLIVINYGLEADIAKILDAGKRDKKIKKEGFLQGIPVGN